MSSSANWSKVRVPSNISGSLPTGRSSRKNSVSFPKAVRKGFSFSHAPGCCLHSVTVDHSVSGRSRGGASRTASRRSLMSSAEAPSSTRILPEFHAPGVGSHVPKGQVTASHPNFSVKTFPRPQFQVLETS